MNKKVLVILLILTALLASSCEPAAAKPSATTTAITDSCSVATTANSTAKKNASTDAPVTETVRKDDPAKKTDPTKKEVTTATSESGLAEALDAASDSTAADVRMVIDYKYDDATVFNSYGYAVVGVLTDGVMKYGIIGEDGAYVMEPVYEAFHSTLKDLCFSDPSVDNGYIWLKKDGLWGFVNEKCAWVIHPTYEDCTCFTSLGLAGIKVDGKWGFVSASGDVVVSPVYDEVRMNHRGNENGVCKDGKWGLIDSTGKEIIAPISSSAFVCDGDFAEFGLWHTSGQNVFLMNDASTLITKDGKIIIDNTKDWIRSISPNLLYITESQTLGRGYFNMEGVLVIPLAENETGYSFTDDGIAIVRSGIREPFSYRYIDSQGNTLFGREFEDAMKFASNGLACVKIDGKCGYIDRNGVEVIAPEYDDASSFFENGYAAVIKDGKAALIDGNGTLMTDFLFSGISPLDPLAKDCYFFRAGQDGGCGVIDKNGTWLLPPEYEQIILYRPGVDEGWSTVSFSGVTYATVCKDDLFGVISMRGEDLTGLISDDIPFYIAPNGYVAVHLNGKFGYVDLDG